MVLYIMLILAYLVGSLSFAVIISKMMKLDDPRSYGSQNAGATNVMRSGNKKAAILTLLGDFAKGLLVVLIARFVTRGIDGGDALVGICGVMVVIGHIYPIFFKFKGGKGVATSLGVLLGFNPLLALLLAGSWFIIFKVSKISSLAAIVATILSPLYAYFLVGNSSYFGAATIIAFFVVYMHKANIIRLIRGTEGGFKKAAAENPKESEVAKPHLAKPPLAKQSQELLDYYSILGVAHSASQDEIQNAYHLLAVNLTPEDEAFPAYDDGSKNAEAEVVVAQSKIQEAYATLSDPLLRLVYDQALKDRLTESTAND